MIVTLIYIILMIVIVVLLLLLLINITMINTPPCSLSLMPNASSILRANLANLPAGWLYTI